MNSTTSVIFGFCMIFIATMAFSGGCSAMSTQPLEIKWEWPAGRQMETKLLINIKKISKASKGLFGIGASPSMANALPDATDVSASIESGQENLVGRELSIRIPGMEAQKLKVGEHAAIGLVEGNTIGICVSAAPTADKQELANWFNQWRCE
ncbi:hypothetical protein [Methylobacter sp.]|uniref:hypothetical protein n=1 Tax=Methylobacter sp. TaxID=2051955 RepID=UPI002590A7F6|nr:hypothetical protein [Methylobacter sp.]